MRPIILTLAIFAATILAREPRYPGLEDGWREKVIECINKERKREGDRSGKPRPALKVSPALSGVAQGHSDAAAPAALFPEPKGASAKLWAEAEKITAGRVKQPFGVAVAKTPFAFSCRVAELVVNLPEIRESLLKSDYSWVGIGATRGVADHFYWTFLLAHDLK